MTSKYQPLAEFLSRQRTVEIPMSFAEIERVVGLPLPERASRNRAWWSNNPSNNVMTKVWLRAGFRTERVDVGARRLVFRRAGSDLLNDRSGVNGPPDRTPFEILRTTLAGTVTINCDLTQPTGEVWEAQVS